LQQLIHVNGAPVIDNTNTQTAGPHWFDTDAGLDGSWFEHMRQYQPVAESELEPRGEILVLLVGPNRCLLERHYASGAPLKQPDASSANEMVWTRATDGRWKPRAVYRLRIRPGLFLMTFT
jgi:hypothetical protein